MQVPSRRTESDEGTVGARPKSIIVQMCPEHRVNQRVNLDFIPSRSYFHNDRSSSAYQHGGLAMHRVRGGACAVWDSSNAADRVFCTVIARTDTQHSLSCQPLRLVVMCRAFITQRIRSLTIARLL